MFVFISGIIILFDQVSLFSRVFFMVVLFFLKLGFNIIVNDVDLFGDLESNFYVQIGVEKLKVIGFLKSLLKSEKKDWDNVVFFGQFFFFVFQYERIQIFGLGDGMDEIAVFDNTIWITEKRDLFRIEGLLQNYVIMEKILVESNCEKIYVFYSGDVMEEIKVFIGIIWIKEEIFV